MTMAQEEFTKKIYEYIWDKVFLSNGSGQLATVVEKLPESIVPGKVLFDGLMLFDGIEGVEDDIQQMTSFTKERESVNVEDYYTDNGAFEEDERERFIAALERLMTVEEFKSWIFREIEFGDVLYTKDGNKLIYLAEKDGLYYCGIRGCSESIPYDYTGKCLLSAGKGLDVSDGKLDVDYRIYPVEIEHTYNVEKLRAALHDRHHPIASKTDILVDLEYGIVNAYQSDGFYHILTQRLCPNPYFDKYAD